MALSNYVIYQTELYRLRTEVLNEQINAFNAAVKGGIILGGAETPNVGDYTSRTFFKKISGGTVRRRNAHADTTITQKSVTMDETVSVKVASGTFELRYSKGDLDWIKQSPDAAAAAHAQQLAIDTFADLLSVALGVYCAAVAGQAEVYTDVSAGVGDAGKASWANLLANVGKFGDAFSRIQAWVMHSKSAFDIWGQNLANANALFTYDNVKVLQDPQGRPVIVTDLVPSVAGSPTDYFVAGLSQGAVVIENNNDWRDNLQDLNGNEQILSSYQAQWSNQYSLKGFSWDTATGGPSPNNAALFSAGNWDRKATDKKDLAGVLLRVQ